MEGRGKGGLGKGKQTGVLDSSHLLLTILYYFCQNLANNNNKKKTIAQNHQTIMVQTLLS